MATLVGRRPLVATTVSVDPTWRDLYRAGGVSAAAFVALIVVSLVLSFLMLRGVFHKGVGYLGIATGALGTASEVLRPILGIGYLSYGLLLPAWLIAVGWRLYRLG